MERGFGYARERPGPWQDYFPRDRDEGIYYRDPQSYYSRQAHQPQHARYYGPEERVNGRRYEPPFEENKVVRGHRKEPSDPKEIGFSYTSGIRNMQDIKFRQMHQPPRRHEGRDAAFDHRRERRSHEAVSQHNNGLHDSMQHPRREFFEEWSRGRRERSPSPRRNVPRGAGVREDFDMAAQSRAYPGRSSPPQYRQREPVRRTDANPNIDHRSRQMAFRSYSPTDDGQRRPNLGRQAFRPRSNSLESYWGPATSPSDSNELFPESYYESSGSSPTQHRMPFFQKQPRDMASAGQRSQPQQPFIPQPDYTWHKKKKRLPVQYPDYPF